MSMEEDGKENSWTNLLQRARSMVKCLNHDGCCQEKLLPDKDISGLHLVENRDVNAMQATLDAFSLKGSLYPKISVSLD